MQVGGGDTIGAAGDERLQGLGEADDAQAASAAGSDPAQAQLASIEAALARVPKQTSAASGLPGDPVNLAFVGSEADRAINLTGFQATSYDAGPA